MSFTEFAAIVGALAWIPPIFTTLRAWLTKPEIRVITQPSPQIGFTTLGPILNLRLALTVKHKDIVVTGIQLHLTHESGDRTTFSWRGIIQNMGTLNYPQIGAIPFEKEMNVLAMKVSLKDVEERFIRFQSLEFLQQKAELEAVSLKKLAYLQQSGEFDGSSFLKSQEMSDLYSFTKQAFSWKPGQYRIQVILESPDTFSLLDADYSFTLSPLHVQNMSSNLSHIEQFYANEVLPLPAEQKPIEIQWKWVFPDMQKIEA